MLEFEIGWPAVRIAPVHHHRVLYGTGRMMHMMHMMHMAQGTQLYQTKHHHHRVLHAHGIWHAALSDQAQPCQYILNGAYYLKGRESRP